MSKLPPGLYLLRQRIPDKLAEHWGVLDIGNQLRHRRLTSSHSVVIHRRTLGIRVDRAQNTGSWTVVQRVADVEAARVRLRTALREPQYNLFENNCEHFARYIATGHRESVQVQRGMAYALSARHSSHDQANNDLFGS
jgi:hypothetical protein